MKLICKVIMESDSVPQSEPAIVSIRLFHPSGSAVADKSRVSSLSLMPWSAGTDFQHPPILSCCDELSLSRIHCCLSTRWNLQTLDPDICSPRTTLCWQYLIIKIMQIWLMNITSFAASVYYMLYIYMKYAFSIQ